MTVESVKKEALEDKEQELVKLKAEAFDLHMQRDHVNGEINKRLEVIYAEINKFNA